MTPTSERSPQKKRQRLNAETGQLTIRDKLACAISVSDNDTVDMSLTNQASYRYRLADAMLAERKKQ
jgi:hypothetical protein